MLRVGSISNQRGVGLIEILISLIIVTTGLLGLAALQGKAQKAEMESYERSQALILLRDMAERLRANRPGRSEYLATVGYGSHFTDTASCTSGNGAAQDLSCWHMELSGSAERTAAGEHSGAMMKGHGCITSDNENDGNGFILTVAWQGMTPVTSAPNDPRLANQCGQGLYGGEPYRRIVSTSVRFFKPN